MALDEPSSRQIDSIIQLSIAYSFTNQDSCLMLGKKSVDLSKHHPDQSVYAKAVLELGDTYRIFGKLDEGEVLIQEGRALYESLGDEKQLAYADNKLGALNANRGTYEEAIKYYLSALEIWENLKDSQNIIKPYINIGAVFKNLNRLDKAAEYYDKAIEWADIIKDDRGKMYAFNNQALIYNDKAVNYSKAAENNPTQVELLKDSASFFIQKALGKYEQALSLARKIKDNRFVVQSLGNMADLKTTMGLYQESLNLGKEAEIIAQDIGSITSIISIKTNQSEAYRLLGQLKKAAQYGEEAVKLAKEKSITKYEAAANEQLYQTYKAAGVYEKALSNLEALKEFQVSNGELNRNKAIAEVETKFQTAQKEKQILKQQHNILELEIINAQIAQQKNRLIGAGCFVSFMILLGFQINRIRKERNDKRAFTEAWIYAQEAERKRIARDLHDGIGQSLLLIKKQMESTHQLTLGNQQMITDTLEEVRSISQDLHPFQLEKFGLTATIQDAIQKVSTSTSLFITKEIDNIDGLLPEKSEIHIFRTIQEALSNVVKHADATAAKVSIKSMPTEIILSIQDNGKGFDQELAIVKSKSLGLRTMYERISAIGGQLKIANQAPTGTIISINIPKKR